MVESINQTRAADRLANAIGLTAALKGWEKPGVEG